MNANDSTDWKTWETGVYKWTNLVNQKVYVGGAYKSFILRFRNHLDRLRNNKHWNRHLQAAWNKYPRGTFIFSIIEECAPEEVEGLEDYWIKALKATNPDFGYNIKHFAKSSLGVKRSKETKRRLSKSAKEAQNRPEVKAKISAAHTGRIVSETTKAKLSSAAKKQWSDPVAREAMAKLIVGKRHSEASKRKISKANKMIPHTKEWNSNVSEALKGKRASVETRRKLSEVHRSCNLSLETRAKMSEAAKRRCKTPEGISNLIKAGRATHEKRQRA